MTYITITALKKMTAATLQSKIPFEITYNGKPIAAVLPINSRITAEDGTIITTEGYDTVTT